MISQGDEWNFFMVERGLFLGYYFFVNKLYLYSKYPISGIFLFYSSKASQSLSIISERAVGIPSSQFGLSIN